MSLPALPLSKKEDQPLWSELNSADTAVIYHMADNDGRVAALAARLRIPTARFIPMDFGMPLPDLSAKTAFILDYYPNAHEEENLAKLRAIDTVFVIDHHPQTQELAVIWDKDKSACRLAWEFFIGSSNHWIVDYTEDWDLWRFKLPQSKEVNAAIYSYGDNYRTLMSLLNRDWIDLAEEGEAILRYQNAVIGEIVDAASREVIFESGERALAVNSSRWQSEIGARLSFKHNLVAIWYETADGRYKVSLRSSKDNPDATDAREVAMKYGGGGHVNAASFRSDRLPWLPMHI